MPDHGWLPVDFFHMSFHLNMDASDALNDPISELLNAITTLQNHEKRRITWWLEPAAYFFDIKKEGQNIILTIIQSDDLHNERAGKKELLTVVGDDGKILEPFRIALRQFLSKNFENNHWPCNLDKNQLQSLAKS